MKFLPLILLALAPAANADGFFSALPKSEFVYYAAEAADISTTLDIKNHPDLHETNPILGTHPSDSKILLEGIGGAVLHTFITKELQTHFDGRYVKLWEYSTITMETAFAAHNLSIGLRFRF